MSEYNEETLARIRHIVGRWLLTNNIDDGTAMVMIAQELGI